jgi:hypothetical protein
VADLALGQLNKGVYQFLPAAGFQFLDSLICVIPQKKLDAIKIFAQQTTFESVADHAQSRNFVAGEYKTWQDGFRIGKQKKRKFEWHLVWVLTNAEKAKQHKQTKNHGKEADGTDVKYKEWFFSFKDFEVQLGILIAVSGDH